MVQELEKYCIRESATMKDAIATIQNSDDRCAVIVNDIGKVVGVFSEGDVLRAILSGIDVHTPLRGLIKPSFRYLKSRDLDAARQLIVFGLPLIPVLDDGHRLQSVITVRDICTDNNA